MSRTSTSSSRWCPEPTYARWRDLVLTLRRYALDDHVLLDTAGAVPTPSWLRLNSIVLSWILGTISLDLHNLIRNTPSARGAWLALEGQLLGNAEAQAPRLNASFRTFVQGDLSVSLDNYGNHGKERSL